MYFLSRTTTEVSRWSIVQHNLTAPDLSVNKVMNKERQEIFTVDPIPSQENFALRE